MWHVIKFSSYHIKPRNWVWTWCIVKISISWWRVLRKKIFWLGCRDHPMQSSICNNRGSRTRMTVKKRSSLGVRLNIIYIKHSCSSRTESTLTPLVKEWKKNPQIKPTPYPAGVWTVISSCAIGFQMKNTLFAQVFWKVLTKNRKVKIELHLRAWPQHSDINPSTTTCSSTDLEFSPFEDNTDSFPSASATIFYWNL